MQLTQQLPLASNRIPFISGHIVCQFIHDELEVAFVDGPLKPERQCITGRFSHTEPNFEAVPKVHHENPCADIPCEMSTGRVWDFLEAAMGPIFYGRVPFSGKDGLRVDPDSGEMILCVNGQEFNLTNMQGTSIDADDNPESSDSSFR